MFRVFVMMSILLLLTSTLSAQQPALPTPLTVEIAANDGLTLVGDYYAQAEAAPAVLLLHMLGSQRGAWQPILVDLYGAGYAVLAVDLRGHGDSGGAQDWVLAEADVQTWLDWLREQDTVRDEALAIVGASIGGNLALLGCANDAACVTAVALSPGLDYRGVAPENAVVEGLAERSALLVAAQGDGYSADSVKQMAAAARGEIGLRLFSGSRHGTNFFLTESARARIANVIITWLDEHQPPA